MSEMTAKNIRIIFSGDFLDGAEVCYPIVGFDLAKPGGDMHSENEQIVSPFERAIREYTRACLGLSNDWRTFKCALTKKPKSNDIFAEANLTRIGGNDGNE